MPDDGRADQLKSLRFEPMKFDKLALETFAINAGLQQVANIVMTKTTRETTFSLNFPGGSMEELLEQVAQAVPVNLSFDPWSIRFNLDLNATGPEELDEAIQNPAIALDAFEISPGLLGDMIHCTVIPARDFDMDFQEFLGEIVRQYRYSGILQGSINPQVVLHFKGGTLRELLEQTAITVPTHIEVTNTRIVCSRPYLPGEREELRKKAEEQAERMRNEPPSQDPFAPTEVVPENTTLFPTQQEK